MNKDTLILADETIIEMETGASLNNMNALFSSKEVMLATWDMLTVDNLSEVRIKNSDGLVIGCYKNLVLVSETSVINEDGSVLTTFNLREKTAIEKQLEETASQAELNAANIDYLAMESGVEL